MGPRLGRVVWIAWLLVSAASSAASERPRSILVLEQSDVRGPFYAEIFTGLRAAVNASATGPVTLYVENLDISRFHGDAYEQSLRDHFAVKYKDHPVGVIVTVGAAAVDFAIRRRADLWPDVPIVLAFVDESSFPALDLSPDVTGRLTRLRLADMVTAAQAVVPDIKRVAIVGDSLEKQTVFRHFHDEIQGLSPALDVIDLTGLPMIELKSRVAALPEQTAILYTAIYSDGAGTYFPPADAVAMIAEVANRPIIAPVESYIGRGAIGGYVAVPAIIGSEAGDLALRILEGDSSAALPIAVGDSLRPIFDWRQLKRWGVDERALPAGSEVRDRVPSLWEEYAWEITATAVVLFLQTGLVVVLLSEHDRRRRAELQARQRMAELAHMNRRTTAGELSSTIAHELNQPLGAIQNNATAAQRLLARKDPDLEEVGRILADVKRDNARASDVIERVRRLVRKAPPEARDVDVSDSVREVFEFMGPQATASGTTLDRTQGAGLLVVKGDPVQLQQVVLNLVLNAIESVSVQPEGERRIAGRTYLSGASLVGVAISDSGPGVPEDRLASIFEPFATTKTEGMGMGLSIARSIVEAHGGRIWAENDGTRGAVFRFTLPRAAAGSA
jgi:signal transduction histidine kinase